MLLCAPSWCGSTLLSYLLDGHSEILSGGGLLWFFSKLALQDPSHPLNKTDYLGFASGKTFNQIQHPIWDPVPLLPFENLFPDLRKLLGVNWIVDSSKHGPWFTSTMAGSPEENFILVILHKSPWGFAASAARYKHLAYVASTRGVPTVQTPRWGPTQPPNAAASPDINQVPKEKLHEWCQSWLRYYNLQWKRLVDKNPQAQVFFLPYERLAADTKAVLTELLALADLKFEPKMLKEWAKKERHQIGGNSPLHHRKNMGDTKITLDPKIHSANPTVRKFFLDTPGVIDTLLWLGRTPQGEIP